MADLEFDLEHGFSRQEAIPRLERLFAEASATSDALEDTVYSRDGGEFRFSGKYSGVGISGNLSVEDRVMTIRVKLPLMARAFRKPVESRIKEFLGRNLV